MTLEDSLDTHFSLVYSICEKASTSYIVEDSFRQETFASGIARGRSLSSALLSLHFFVRATIVPSNSLPAGSALPSTPATFLSAVVPTLPLLTVATLQLPLNYLLGEACCLAGGGCTCA